METLIIPELPDLPQMKYLPNVARRLWQSDQVKAIWLGGSFAAGNADKFSDFDLHVAVPADSFEHWRTVDMREYVGDEYLEGQIHDFTGNGYLHHFIGASGMQWDVWFLDTAIYMPQEHVLILGCRDDEVRKQLDAARPAPAFDPPVADPAEIRRVLVDYWITTSKHAKVIDRGKLITLYAGLEIEMRYLLRLWYTFATGHDMGTTRFTIHMMAAMQSPLKEAHDELPQHLLGAPVRTVDEIKASIEARHVEVARVGRLLAEKLGFDYPEALEEVVRRRWRETMRGG